MYKTVEADVGRRPSPPAAPSPAIAPVKVPCSEILQSVELIFDGVRYKGSHGRTFWKAAALQHVGQLSEADIADAIRGTTVCNAGRQPNYFHTILKNRLEKRKTSLKQLKKTVWLTPIWPAVHPQVYQPSVYAGQEE